MNPVPDMDGLSCEVKTDERELSGGALPDDEYIPAGGAAAVRFLSLNGTEYIDGGITQAALDKMARMIRSGAAREVCLSVSEYGGEDDEDWEAHLMLPVNDRYDGAELAPVEIGGQSPVRKRHALDDLGLAAECVLHFARTGELYPGLQSEEPDPESMYF